MRSPLGALPSVKLKVKNTLKVWAVAQVRSKVTDGTIAISLIEFLRQAVEEYTILSFPWVRWLEPSD
jgi:hypothetical protein